METATIAIVSFLSALAVYGGVWAVRGKNLKNSIAFAAGLFLAYGLSFVIGDISLWLSNALLLGGAVGLGFFLSFFLNGQINILFFCLLAAFADYFSFSGGLTAKLISEFQAGESETLARLVLSLPVGDSIRPIVSIGDLVVLGSLYAALMELDYGKGRAFVVPTLGFILAIATALTIGGSFGIPFIGGTTVIFLFIGITYTITAAILYLIFLFLIWPTLSG